ncbi:SAM-dependent methyltransferase [Amycolatopsis sp. NBC_00345]|uniref:SAM-dependent methyltransferase n=1 Tax=Amycolatopsis sp. NBC_00345 TaxID=2975955 RepID=UPI002E256301
MGVEVINGVGQTALWTAASRARESARPDRLFEDPYAGLLAGPDGARLLRHFHPSRASDEGNPFLPIRTRWFDDVVAEALRSGIRQVVGLGAGLDTRAYRLDWPDGTVVYEVDQPTVISYKKQVLDHVAKAPRCTLRQVLADLGTAWDDGLVEQGFDRSAPTLWFTEGVLFYLPEDLAADVIRRAAALSAPGSRMAADLIGTGIFRFPYMRTFLARLEESGSPWQFGTDDPAGFFAANGWQADVVTEPGRPGADYSRWSSAANPPGVAILPRSYLVLGHS